METSTGFTAIPGYPKYEVNDKFTMVRSVGKNSIIGLKKGTGKYYLLNTNEDRKLISMEDIKKSLQGVKTAEVTQGEKRKLTSFGKTEIVSHKKTLKQNADNISKSCPKPKSQFEQAIASVAEKQPVIKKEKPVELSKEELQATKEQEDIKQILEGHFNNHEKVWRLHHKKFCKLHIHQLLGISMNNVNKGIWMFEKGHLTSPF